VAAPQARGPMVPASWGTWGAAQLQRAPSPLPAPKRHSSFSEQLPRMIYVASQEGKCKHRRQRQTHRQS
ncbi:unnamed protein product, partial [Bubo scandiacus]